MTAVLASLFTATARVRAQGTPAEEVSKFVGTWRGDSSCVARGTACRDEVVVYQVAKLPEKSGYVSVRADKLVNGQAVSMGTLEFRYEQGQKMLVCEYSQGVWRLKLDGGKMEGTLTAPENVIFRHVTLHKEP
jgi:hypothetical protein